MLGADQTRVAEKRAGASAKLRRCSDYAEVELSNNLAENSMRPVKLGRQNWLHVGRLAALKESTICILPPVLEVLSKGWRVTSFRAKATDFAYVSSGSPPILHQYFSACPH